MGLIKSSNAPASVTPFSVADIERQAKLILLRARQQAEQLLAAAQSEAEAIRQEAHAQGLAEGRREGLEAGLQQGRQAGAKQALDENRTRLEQAAQSLTAAMTALDANRADLEASALREVVELAVAIARRVARREGSIDPGVLASNLTDAMHLVVGTSDLRIAIHPSQRATLDAAMPELKLRWPDLRHVRIVDDASLSPGGCRLFTADGLVDADLDTQLDRIVAELLPAPDA